MTIIVWFIPSHRSHSLMLLFLWYVVCGDDRKRKHIHTSSISLSLALLPSLLLLLNKHFLHTNTVVSFLTWPLTWPLICSSSQRERAARTKCSAKMASVSKLSGPVTPKRTVLIVLMRSTVVSIIWVSFYHFHKKVARDALPIFLPVCTYISINTRTSKLNNEINK